MAQALKKLAVSDAPVIPDRLYFKIGDVARICGVETYVLRFWETQFPQLKPNKSGTGQRLYRRREVELALEIKRLVHREGYTIAGAKHVLDDAPKPQPAKRASTAARGSAQAQPPRPVGRENVAAAIGSLRAELRELLSILGTKETAPHPPQVTVRTKTRILRVHTETEPLFPL
ncbi:MAG TPA: MerR family transcriptional regulator [Terracidiphilus sp.]|jgi:DNA-binding transcriptional MerR regulator